ncbi:BppU family phage baseplate upper protein [Lactobacillus gasseri]|uniref:BppU family phage baseplate upper protein n=1 Tax=Lactobacillus gasseri TaxID=1596 RepID=UPI00237D768B|nr:BppU family phage baseplate upper protein [Lactobacillus gasseri]MDE1533976.1 BppU family phage baseplate upper protein [Lactobacillus gasseri]
MLQALNLSTNKQTTNLSRVEVRDSDKGEILESFILNPDGTPYDLTNKSLVFNENKDGNKFVSDDNVKIVDERIGHITYQLHDQVHSARGTAWFDIIDKSNGSKIDSTTDFYIEVRDSLKCTVYNTTYIADLEKLKQQMETLLKQADGELQAELQKAEQQLDQELQNFRNQYNSLSADFQNQFKAAQNARQQDYTNQKNAINQDWTNNKNQIWGQWNGDKANIDKQAQDTIQAIKDNAKQVLDKDQADWNAKQHSWDDTFSRIVKEWQVKTNSLNNTVQDLTTKFGNIINELTDLMNKKLPDMNAKTDAVQAKVNELRASLGQIDWTSFAKDLELKKWIFNSESGWIQLKSNMTQWRHSNEMIAAARISYDDVSRMNIYDYTGVAGFESSILEVSDLTPNTLYRLFFEWENSKQLTKMADNDYKFRVSVYDKNNTDNILAYQDLPADPVNKELFCLTFDTNNVTDVFIELNTGGLNNGIHFTWKIGNWLLKPVQEHVPIVAIKNNTDLNTIKTPGMYHARGTDGIANSPIPAWFDITVNSDGMKNGTQMLHAKKENQVYVRSWYNGNTFTDWQRITNAGDLATKLSLSGGNMQKGSWINWDAQSPYNAHEGNIGGIQWNGASDSIKIFGDNNAGDNLDLAIQLGDDDSNHISFRRADGDEVAAINMDGYYTGSVGWNNIRSKPDVAQKSDLNVNVIRDYNIETDQPGPTTVEQAGKPGLVDQATLATFARAYRDVRNHTDYRYPTDQALNTAINLNSDPYLDTGIYKIGNCVITNGPWADTTSQSFYLTVIKYDDNTIYQTVDQGPERFVRTVSKTTNSYPQWNQFAMMNRVTDLSDRLQGFTMQQTMFQHRVDYDSPSGTISNQTVDFNDYKETGIVKFVNCFIQNGPYKTDNRHTIFLKVTNLDGQTQYQTVYEGDDLYGRKLFNGSGQWHSYTNTTI